MKRLKLYYWYIGLPVLLVAVGSALFHTAIINTVKGNPHPQINYIIFVLVVAGCYQMLAHVRRINHEGALFRQYRRMAQSNVTAKEVDDLLQELKKEFDVLPLIQLIQGLRGAPLNSVQHSAVESELERFAARQSRRLNLAQFMGGLMVGMGLLGTFIGLLGALAEIGKLIGSFNLGAGMADPLAAISELVARLTAPMQAMGVAFSASLFGVLGSLIMGVLMVGVRSASSDLVSFVQSDAWLMLEITPPSEESATVRDIDPVAKALSELAEHSPLLAGLAVALDHSERRVRELVSSLDVLAARVDTATVTTTSMLQYIQKSSEAQERNAKAMEQMQIAQVQLTERQAQMSDASTLIAKQLGQQSQLMQTAFAEQNQRISLHMKEQQDLWQSQAESQRQSLEAQQSNWQTKVRSDGQARQEETAYWIEIQQAGLQQIVSHVHNTELLLNQLAEQLLRTSTQQSEIQVQQASQQRELLKAIEQSSLRSQAEAQARSGAAVRMDAMLQESQVRTEQIIHLLARSNTQ